MKKRRVVSWRLLPSAGVETAWIVLEDSRLSARGRAVGTEPFPYWVDYELKTGNDFVTQTLDVTIQSSEETRTLELRFQEGRWTVNGAPRPDLSDALDCDLGLCPLTNTMPILRHEFHTRPGRHEFLMAWVAVPELTVRPSRQTYTHLATVPEGARVRYESGAFASDLLVDREGLVIEYPQLASRIALADKPIER